MSSQLIATTCPFCRGKINRRAGMGRYPYTCVNCNRVYTTEDLIQKPSPLLVGEIEEEIINGEAIEIEVKEVKESGPIPKEQKREDSAFLKENHFRIDYGKVLSRITSLLTRKVAFAYKWDWETRIATAYFTFRSWADPFSRPAARRVLRRHIEGGTHCLVFKSFCPGGKVFERNLGKALVEHAREHPEDFPREDVEFLLEHLAPKLCSPSKSNHRKETNATSKDNGREWNQHGETQTSGTGNNRGSDLSHSGNFFTLFEDYRQAE